MENPQFENPPAWLIAVSYIFFPLLVIYLLVLVIIRRIQKAAFNRKHEKMFGRKMNFIEDLMYDMDHPLGW